MLLSGIGINFLWPFFFFAALHFCSHLLLIVVWVLCHECTCFIPSSWAFLKYLAFFWCNCTQRYLTLGSSAEPCTVAQNSVGYPKSRLYLIHFCCRSQRMQVKRSRLGNVCICNMEWQDYYNCPMPCAQYRISICFLVHLFRFTWLFVHASLLSWYSKPWYSVI